jgi:kinesin family protein 2/24
MSSKRRLDLVRYRSRHEKMNTSSAVASTKKVITFEELQALNCADAIKTKPTTHPPRLTPKKVPKTTPRLTPKKVPDITSPLAQRIRQTFLSAKPDEAKPITSEGTPFSERRQRLERNKLKHRLGNSRVTPRSGFKTPIGAESEKTQSFFTPSPTLPVQKRVTTPRSTTSLPIFSSVLKQQQKAVGSTKATSSQGSKLSVSTKTPVGTESEKTQSFFTPSPTVAVQIQTTTPRSNTSLLSSRVLKQQQKAVGNAKATSSQGSKLSASTKSTSVGKSGSTSDLKTPLSSTQKVNRKPQLAKAPKSTGARTPLQSVSNITPNSTRSAPDDTISTRRNLDKRSARLCFAKEFAAQIAELNKSPTLFSPPAVKKKGSAASSSVQVYVRKRPIFPRETQRGDFDVVSIDAASSALVVHRTIMAADMKTKHVEPVSFDNFDATFDGNVDSQEVYERTLAPVVQKVLDNEARAATFLLFGQTGSGKTYTMTACQEGLAEQLFRGKSPTMKVQVQSIELAGKVCRDLMDSDSSSQGGEVVKIQENGDGSVRFLNAEAVTVTSSEELNQLLARVKERRSTQSTHLNDESSRSHAIYQIRLLSTSAKKEGVLTLVDCAGTERRNDSLYHSRERQAESAEINASLYALKECIRARKNGSKHVPYRSNLLTRVLRESLEDDSNALVVIATVAPNATDTEHTMETLKTVSSWTGASHTVGDTQKVTAVDTASVVPKNPKQWNHVDLVEWMSRKRLLEGVLVAMHLDGRAVMRMSKLQLRASFYVEDSDLERAARLFECLRAEASRVDRLDLKRRFAHNKTTP